MKAISYKVSRQGKSVKVERSDGHTVTGSDSSIFDTFLLLPEDNYSQFAFNIDQTVAPALRLLKRETLEKLYKEREAFERPYRFFYIPNKIFSVAKGSQEATLYELDQYFPDEHPQTVTEIQGLAERLLAALKTLGYSTNRFTSPARILQDCVLKYLDLPSIKDKNTVPDEVSEWAYLNGGRLWTEAHQLGHFTDVFDYDISSAFPYGTSRQIDPRYCKWISSDSSIPENAYYGWVKGRVFIRPEATISPLIYKEPETGELSSRTGEWEDVISIHLLNFIERWKIGSFRLEKGWFGIPYKMSYPMEATMQKLFNSRQHGGLAEKIAKRMAAGYWGLTKQTKSDGTFGDYFMPVWNADIADRCTVRVAEFIYRNKIHPIHIGVDGVLCQTRVELGENGFGKWRLSGTEPALVVASGKLWQGSKHPGGMYYKEIMELMKRRPSDREYIRNYKETITLGMAANTDWRLLGKTEEVSSRVNIDTPRDRVFIPHPETGKDILEKKWNSRPLSVYEEESL